MKNLKAIFAMLALSLGLVTTLSSCSSDDKEKTTPAAKSVEGTYNGNMTCSVMGQESDFEDMTFTIASTDDATVNVNISTFGNPPMQVPEIHITGVKVSGTDGKYVLAPTEFSGKTSEGKAYSGTLQGSYDNGTITIQFNLQYGAMPMPMICKFSASKK